MPDEIAPPAEGGESPPAAPSWYYADELPGKGDRPDWLSSKYKTLEDQAKAYKELEKKFGEVPEDYDLSKSKFIDPDYAPFEDLKKFAKEKRIPQEFIDKTLETFDKYMDEFTIDFTEETKKLGENANERLTVLDNWTKANLSKDSYEALNSSLKTAEAFKALEEIRGKMMSNATQIPNGNDGGSAATAATLTEIQNELMNPANLAKYKTDPVYRKDYAARLENASKSAGYIDKVGG